MNKLNFALIAVAVGLTLGLLSASAENGGLPSTRDIADCLHAEDRAICYLQTVSRDSLAPLSQREVYQGKIGLLKQIEGEDGEHLPIEPRNNRRKRGSNPDFDKAVIEPGIRMNTGLIAALALDAAGDPPEVAIAKIVEASEGAHSVSVFAGQVTTSSAPELRIAKYRRLVGLYNERKDTTAKPKPSKGLAELALRNWEVELLESFRTFTDFSKKKNQLQLAEAYALFGDRDGVQRVLEQTDLDDDYRVIKQATLLKDIDTAWAAVRAYVYARDKSKKNDRSLLFDVPRLAHEAHRSDILSQISDELSNSEFVARLLPVTILDALKYLEPDAGIPMMEYLESNKGDIGGPVIADLPVMAELMMRYSREAELDRFIVEMAGEVSDCVQIDARARCGERQLLILIAIRGRMSEVDSILGNAVTDSFANTVPYPPFSAEVDYGHGVPNSVDMMISNNVDSGQIEFIFTSLDNCVQKRIGPAGRNFLRSEPDYEAAQACVLKAIEFSKTPTSILWQNKREDEQFKLGVGGRYKAAKMAFLLAAQTLDNRPDISDSMETAALELLAEAPPLRQRRFGSWTLERLAIAKLKAQGRW
jgi:hypothetical protein